MRYRDLKRSRLSYDEWKCITNKKLTGKSINTDFLKGYIGLLEIEEVSEKQIWKFHGEDIIVCDKGLKWLSNDKRRSTNLECYLETAKRQYGKIQRNREFSFHDSSVELSVCFKEILK